MSGTIYAKSEDAMPQDGYLFMKRMLHGVTGLVLDGDSLHGDAC